MAIKVRAKEQPHRERCQDQSYIIPRLLPLML